MLSYPTAAAIAAAPAVPSLGPALRRLLADRVADWAATDLLGLTHLLVIQPGDTEEDILREVAFSPLVNPIDGRRFGTRGFEPHHDWLEDHGGWFELMFTFQDGFAFVLFVEDAPGADPELLSFCRAYAESPASGRQSC